MCLTDQIRQPTVLATSSFPLDESHSAHPVYDPARPIAAQTLLQRHPTTRPSGPRNRPAQV